MNKTEAINQLQQDIADGNRKNELHMKVLAGLPEGLDNIRMFVTSITSISCGQLILQVETREDLVRTLELLPPVAIARFPHGSAKVAAYQVKPMEMLTDEDRREARPSAPFWYRAQGAVGRRNDVHLCWITQLPGNGPVINVKAQITKDPVNFEANMDRNRKISSWACNGLPMYKADPGARLAGELIQYSSSGETSSPYQYVYWHRPDLKWAEVCGGQTSGTD